MMIYELNDNFYLWQDGNAYTVTPRWRNGKDYKVFTGTLEECREFMELHPYGIPKKKAIEMIGG